ncbi:MAG: hypothetical protein ABL929_07305 [Ferruginibacter sp.]
MTFKRSSYLFVAPLIFKKKDGYSYNNAFGNMLAEESSNEQLVRYSAFVSAGQTSLNIGS